MIIGKGEWFAYTDKTSPQEPAKCIIRILNYLTTPLAQNQVMSTRLKIFISSTMRDDLENERDLVCKRLRELNFEPINAESWGPDSSMTWERIRDEITDCHLFLLLMGKRYGWIPDSGPGANGNKSVTHMEYEVARELNLPILPFLKTLDYETTERDSAEAKARDSFRKEVSDWAKGQFIEKFSLASDLSERVTKAIILMLSNDWVRQRIQERSQESNRTRPPVIANSQRQQPLSLPPPLIEAVRKGNAVLFAGAGMSLAVGLPSAVAFSERLAFEIAKYEPGYDISPSAAVFAGTATDLVLLKGRRTLVNELHDLMNPPHGLQPSVAHRIAVRLFDQIVTTNYDDLFEQAINEIGQKIPIQEGELSADNLPSPCILKLHGSWSRPDSLIITESDVLMLDQTHPKLWYALLELLRTKVVVTVGMSLRDPSIVRLFTEARSTLRGYAVMPGNFRLRDRRLNALNIDVIDSDADTFFSALEQSI